MSFGIYIQVDITIKGEEVERSHKIMDVLSYCSLYGGELNVLYRLSTSYVFRILLPLELPGEFLDEEGDAFIWKIKGVTSRGVYILSTPPLEAKGPVIGFDKEFHTWEDLLKELPVRLDATLKASLKYT